MYKLLSACINEKKKQKRLSSHSDRFTRTYIGTESIYIYLIVVGYQVKLWRTVVTYSVLLYSTVLSRYISGKLGRDEVPFTECPCWGERKSWISCRTLSPSLLPFIHHHPPIIYFSFFKSS